MAWLVRVAACDPVGLMAALLPPPALFVPDREDPDVVVPTDLTRGPWDVGMQHGGAVCGLLGRVVERAAPAGLLLTRLTVEMWRPVPVAPLRTRAVVQRAGRRAAVVDGGLWAGEVQVARATSSWLAPNDPVEHAAGPEAVGRALPPLPDTRVDPDAGDFDYPRPGFNCDAVELRSVVSDTETPGPGIMWTRVCQPVVEGEPLTPLQRVATTADLAAAVGWDWGPGGVAMINTDVTLQLNRYPVGEWVCCDAQMFTTPVALGFCEALLADEAGWFGRVLQSQVASPYRLPVEG